MMLAASFFIIKNFILVFQLILCQGIRHFINSNSNKNSVALFFPLYKTLRKYVLGAMEK